MGEKAVAPPPEGSHWGIRDLIANTTLTFGVNNVFDTRPPYSADWCQSYDPSTRITSSAISGCRRQEVLGRGGGTGFCAVVMAKTLGAIRE
ncbi:MAG: hypothetical protein JO025_17680 [Verrucomicrobia bacterium]|nr:hypothetical protein [Verrucomicrobiota bacterium]